MNTDTLLDFDKISYNIVKESKLTSDELAIAEVTNKLSRGRVITLHEAKFTKRNKETFVKKYGEVENMEQIFRDFEQVRSAVTNKDMFGYSSLPELTAEINKARETQGKKALESILKKISNQRDKNKNGIGTIRSDRYTPAYQALRDVYGEKLTDEDLVDVINGFNELIRAGGDKGLFDYNGIDDLKTAIADGRKMGGNRIDEDPEEGDSTKLFSDENLMIYKVGNYNDSMRFCNDVGNKASWCISYEHSSEYWDKYTSQGVEFVFVMYRNGDKYALAMLDEGHSLEVYNTADLIVSGYALAKQHPEIVNPIRKGGFAQFKSADQYDVSTDEDGYTNVTEEMNGRIGEGRPVTVVTRLDENDEFLDEEKHGTWSMKVVR